MPESELKQYTEDFIKSHSVCALATGTGDYVRCTPLEYSYHDGKFWIFTEGGEKFIGLEKNKDGLKEVLSIEVGENESSKYWLSVLNSLKNRGIQDILILCSDEKTALKRLEEVSKKWEPSYPTSMKRWTDNWDVISPIFKYGGIK